MDERTVTISEESAKVLISICQQLQLPSYQAKLQVAKAQQELESGLATPEAQPVNR